MTLGALILLAAVAGEVLIASKVSKQNKRIGKLEEATGKQKKKES